jgi:hypothetical protein
MPASYALNHFISLYKSKAVYHFMFPALKSSKSAKLR